MVKGYISAPVLIQLVFINREIYDVISKMHWELSAEVICRELNHSGSWTGSWCVCHQYLLYLEFNKVYYHAEERPFYKRTLFTLVMGLEMHGATWVPHRNNRTEIKKWTFNHSDQPHYTPKLQMWQTQTPHHPTGKEIIWKLSCINLRSNLGEFLTILFFCCCFLYWRYLLNFP